MVAVSRVSVSSDACLLLVESKIARLPAHANFFGGCC